MTMQWVRILASIIATCTALVLVTGTIHGVWIPDMLSRDWNVLAEITLDDGATAKVKQRWNDGFYQTVLDLESPSGKLETFEVEDAGPKIYKRSLGIYGDEIYLESGYHYYNPTLCFDEDNVPHVLDACTIRELMPLRD